MGLMHLATSPFPCLISEANSCMMIYNPFDQLGIISVTVTAFISKLKISKAQLLHPSSTGI